MQVLPTLTALVLLSCVSATLPSRRSYDVDTAAACSRKGGAELSCLLGCFKCADTYGRRAYDMAACCVECQATGALLVDDGPAVCSERFFSGVLDVIKGRRRRR